MHGKFSPWQLSLFILFGVGMVKIDLLSGGVFVNVHGIT